MKNARSATPDYVPPRGEEAFEKVRETIRQELAAIQSLAGGNRDEPGTISLWDVVGSMNSVATELRRLRVSLEESPALVQAPGVK